MADEPVSVRIKGVAEFERGAHRLFGNIETEAEAQFRTVADQTATMVRGRVPYQTGTLASSYAGEAASHGAAVGSDLIYAGPVDYGGWPPGRPYIPTGRYLYPTALEARDQLRRAGVDAANHEIRTMLWPKPH